MIRSSGDLAGDSSGKEGTHRSRAAKATAAAAVLLAALALFLALLFLIPGGGEESLVPADGSALPEPSTPAGGAGRPVEARKGPEEANGEHGKELPTTGRSTAPIRGRIFDRKGNPVAGARIAVRRNEGFPRRGILGGVGDLHGRPAVVSAPLAEALSGETGKFSFLPGSLDDGGCRLRVSANGFASALVHDVRVKDGVFARPVMVVMKGPAAILGSVVDSSGTPVQGAAVFAVRCRKGGRLWCSARTGEDGRFRFSDLCKTGTERALEYELIVKKEGLPVISDFLACPFLPGGEAREVEIVLREGFLFEGRVLDRESGKPAQEAKVVRAPPPLLPPRSGWSYGRCDTKEDGCFRIGNLAHGWYYFDFSAPGYVPKRIRIEGNAGDTVWRDVRLARRAVIAGRVVQAGNRAPLEGVRIACVGSEGRVFSAETGPDGSFRVNGPAPLKVPEWPWEYAGKYVVLVFARKRGWVQERPTIVEAPPGAAPRFDIVVPMLPVPKFPGRVTDASGRPLAGVKLTVLRDTRLPPALARGRTFRSLGGRLEGLLGGPDRAQTDAGGRFEIEVVPGQDLHLLACHPGFALAFRSLGDVVPGGTLRRIDIDLVPGGCIEGVVLDENGGPVCGERIEYSFRTRKETDAWLWAHPEVRSVMEEVRTGPKGAFHLQNLPPGGWVLGVEGSEKIPFRRIELAGGATVQVRFRVAASLSIEGVVVGESGEPLEGVFVDATALVGEGYGETVTDAGGAFRIEGLPEGEYELFFIPEGEGQEDYPWKELENIRAGTKEIRVVLKKIPPGKDD